MNNLKPNNDHYYVITIWFVFLAVLLFATSCKPAKVVVKEIVTETITEQVHDTVFITEPDESMLQALLECQDGKVVIKEVIKEVPGKSILHTPNIDIKDNVLEVDCEARAQELFAEWKSTHTQKTTEITKEVPVPYTPLGMKILAWIGGISAGLFLIGFIINKIKR